MYVHFHRPMGMGEGTLLPGGEVARVWSWPLTSI